MKITYTNIYDKPMTASEAVEFGDYEKIYEEARCIKKIESFMQHTLYAITYYVQEGESEVNILSNLSNMIKRDNKVVILKQRTTLDSYTIEVAREYRNEVLTFKNKYLYDSNERLVCNESSSLATDKPIYEKTIKYYYGVNYHLFEELYDDEPIFKATYKEVWN